MEVPVRMRIPHVDSHISLMLIGFVAVERSWNWEVEMDLCMNIIINKKDCCLIMSIWWYCWIIISVLFKVWGKNLSRPVYIQLSSLYVIINVSRNWIQKEPCNQNTQKCLFLDFEFSFKGNISS